VTARTSTGAGGGHQKGASAKPRARSGEPRERPILFSGPMVRAILAGTKTQTRRVVRHPDGAHGCHWCGTGWAKRDPKNGGCTCEPLACPFGQPGDRLWVRERWWHYRAPHLEQAGFVGGTMCRLPDGLANYHANPDFDPSAYEIWRCRPSIHMPRWASRLTLEVTGVRVERLQDLSEEDARAEGVTPTPYDPEGDCWATGKHRTAFEFAWNSLYGWEPNAWNLNPWVWVVEFRRLENRGEAGCARQDSRSRNG